MQHTATHAPSAERRSTLVLVHSLVHSRCNAAFACRNNDVQNEFSNIHICVNIYMYICAVAVCCNGVSPQRWICLPQQLRIEWVHQYTSIHICIYICAVAVCCNGVSLQHWICPPQQVRTEWVRQYTYIYAYIYICICVLLQYVAMESRCNAEFACRNKYLQNEFTKIYMHTCIYYIYMYICCCSVFPWSLAATPHLLAATITWSNELINMYIYTAHPTCCDIFQSWYQSSKPKLVGLFSLKRGKKDFRALGLFSLKRGKETSEL